MEPTIIGFKEYSTDGSLKLVPWISWDEWDTVRVSLFSSSHVAVSSALNRITAWRSRGCLPLIVEITASLIEIQQKDPYFRVDTDNKDASESEEVLAMLYCMAIMRLVNGVVEKTRKKTEVSIGEAADTINIPRMLIDIRHECSHRDLPSLRLVRLASIKALDWLKSYYWEPQKKSIQSESDGASRIKKEIKYKLCELASFLQMKNAESTFPIKRKCGSNKQISKAMKNLVRIYSSYSVEVVSVVVELLLKESGSSDFLCLDDDNHMQSIFDNWKSVITKLSNKEPEFLLTLIKTVHEMIETREANTCGSGVLAIPEDTAKGNHTDRLSDLFAWLVIILKGLKSRKKESHGVKETYPADTKLPKSTLVELLRKSLLVSPRNSQLKCTTLTFANMIGNNSLVEKLNRLFLLSASNPECYEENSSNIGSEIMFTQQEDDIKQAAEKIALLRSRKKQRKVTQRAAETNDGKGWNVVKEWKKCPIGMLSLGAASSGILPVLDIDEDHNQYLSENKEQGSLVLRNFKRKPDCDIEFLNETSGKKKRENEIDNRQDEKDELYSLGVQGKLMIGGVWKKVEEQELFAIAADIRVFV